MHKKLQEIVLSAISWRIVANTVNRNSAFDLCVMDEKLESDSGECLSIFEIDEDDMVQVLCINLTHDYIFIKDRTLAYQGGTLESPDIPNLNIEDIVRLKGFKNELFRYSGEEGIQKIIDLILSYNPKVSEFQFQEYTPIGLSIECLAKISERNILNSNCSLESIHSIHWWLDKYKNGIDYGSMEFPKKVYDELCSNHDLSMKTMFTIKFGGETDLKSTVVIDTIEGVAYLPNGFPPYRFWEEYQAENDTPPAVVIDRIALKLEQLAKFH